jgi:hypothetical protein
LGAVPANTEPLPEGARSNRCSRLAAAAGPRNSRRGSWARRSPRCCAPAAPGGCCRASAGRGAPTARGSGFGGSTAPGRNKPLENLRLKLLQWLLDDEIRRSLRKNQTRARSFHELLRATLEKYHNRLIDAPAMIREIIRIRDELRAEERRADALGLDDDELAFYDAVAANLGTVFD